jgi:hypothetical protein
MGRVETQQIIDQARLWADYYTQVQAQRQLVRLAAERALDGLKGSLLPVRIAGAAPAAPTLSSFLTGGDDEKNIAWRVLPLGPRDVAALAAIAHYVGLEPIDDEVGAQIGQLADAVPEALADIAAAKRPLASARAKEAAAEAVEFLTDYVEWGAEEGLVAIVKSLEPQAAPAGIEVVDALTPRVGLAAIWRSLGGAELVAAPMPAAPDPGDVSAADVRALKAAIAASGATHLAVFSTPPRSAAGLVAVLGG